MNALPKRLATFFALCTVLTVYTTSLSEHRYLLEEYNKFERTILSHNENPGIHISETQAATRSPKKPWTFIVYMAADNDLRAFAANNIKQMASIGSNNHVNILVHLDIRLNGNQKITRRYYIEKNKITHMNHESNTQRMDSGDPKTLVSCCEWAIKNYPAQHYALILWNHGTGIIDPRSHKIINPAELFTFNPESDRFELDRSVGFLDLLSYMDQRGICWDNSTGNYLTNQKLDSALNEICTRILHRKFDVIGFDACLMSMIEIGTLMKKHADIMVGSQEVELGTGWNYSYVLQSLANNPQSPLSFSQHIVGAYKSSYHNITNDFTQSAVDLKRIHLLEKNVDTVGSLLIECLAHQEGGTVKNGIRAARNKKTCTHFDEPSYIDLFHFYSNLQKQRAQFVLKEPHNQLSLQLQNALDEGKRLITTIVVANSAGKSLKDAHGLSIYFPEHRIHVSYPLSSFAKSNRWATFIARYAQH